MTEQHFSSKKGQKRTGLLALSAHQRKTSGACLSSEFMTALVEERCPTDEKELALTHLADCERCYREWLTLNALRQPPASKGTVLQFFSRPRNLAAFGSLLAAAASVALFLNIRYPDSPQILHEEVREPVPRLEQKASQPDGELENTALPSDRTDTLEKSEFGASISPEAEGGQVPPPAAPRPVPSPKKQPLQQQAVAPQLEEAPARKARTLSSTAFQLNLTTWQKEIAAGCERGEQAVEYWTARKREGHLLLRGPLTDADRATVQDIVKIMEAESKGVHAFCSKIDAALL